MLLKEYRICMPLTTEEYRRGQQYMINRHSDEQSEAGEGVEVVCNEPHFDADYGHGKYTEKRIHLNSRLPGWAKAITPAIYVTEKAWNYYPYTVTEYSCHFLPRLKIFIETRYEDNNGRNDAGTSKFFKVKEHNVTDADLAAREVEHLDIAYDNVPEKCYKETEDCTKFRSKKTGRGPLLPGWRESHKPVMCSFKLVLVKFEVWGLQTRVESFIQKSIRDILIVGHRQAFAWVDLWYDMSLEHIKKYELDLQAQTNFKVLGRQRSRSEAKDSRSLSSTSSSSLGTRRRENSSEQDEADVFVDACS